jgi:prepilin-type N-terminal cleavage/methylation domain-containing protein
MKKNHKLGFSLVEISVVVLIIGILIAAITTGTNLVKKYKIASAQNLSANNPIYAMKDLVLWFEPTLGSSFNNFDNITDGYELDAWLNNSPSYNIGNAVAAGNKPIYVKYTINDIPSVTFTNDGNEYFEINDVASLLENSDLSIFILEKRNKAYDGQVRNIITSSGNGINISYNVSNQIVVKDKDGNVALIGENPRDVNLHYLTLYDGVDDGANNYDFKIATNTLIKDGYYHYLNKKLPESGVMSAHSIEIDASDNTSVASSSRFATGSIGNLRLGSDSNSFVGNISEVIIFNRKLRKQELLDIFKYFEAKYNLSLSTT